MDQSPVIAGQLAFDETLEDRQVIFGTAYGFVRILVVGPFAYLILIGVLRISGKRTLAKMNAFDFVVTVALGSTLATVLLSKDVSLLEGVLAFAVLAALQFAIAWMSQRFATVKAAVKAEPRMLLCDGKFILTALRDERVTEDEIKSAVRSYKAAMTELGNRGKQDIGRWAKNRVENSHIPLRRRERAMLRFRQMKSLQKFASVHANIHSHFNTQA